jgi:hypothetical protein
MSQLKQQQTIPYFRTLCRYSLTLISTLFFIQYDRDHYTEHYKQLLATIPEDEKEIDITYFRFFGLATYALPAARSTLAQMIYHRTGVTDPETVRRQIIKSQESISTMREMQALRRPSSCSILGINSRISREVYIGLVTSARSMLTLAERSNAEQAATQAGTTQSTAGKHERDHSQNSDTEQAHKKTKLTAHSLSKHGQYANPVETWQRDTNDRSVLQEIPVTVDVTNISDDTENGRSVSRPSL